MAHIYNESDIRADYHKLTKLLISKGLHITTMESATSGQIASLITDTEGASAIFKGALITYCNEEKTQGRCFCGSQLISILYIRKRQQWQWQSVAEQSMVLT